MFSLSGTGTTHVHAGTQANSGPHAMRMKTPIVLATMVSVSGCARPLPPATAGDAAAEAFRDADSTRTTTVAPGVTHTFVHHPSGPWAIHVVSIDPRACTPALEVMKPGADLGARATTSQIAGDAPAAINADFFMLPGGTPVGAHVHEGVTLIGPTDRPVFAVTDEGFAIGVARMNGDVRVRDDAAAIRQVNRPSTRFSAYAGTHDGITVITSWIGDSIPADSAALRVTLRPIDGSEAGGRAVVERIDATATRAAMPENRVVLHAHGSARSWAARRTPGDTVRWSARVRVGDADAREAVGGFPELIRAGRDVLGEQSVRAEFGAARHPRTAVGWTAAGELLLVVVDGRQPPYSAGMSLDELTWLFHRLGATDALNLDGGGSSALVIRGSLMNRPSDVQGERAVGNALVLRECS